VRHGENHVRLQDLHIDIFLTVRERRSCGEIGFTLLHCCTAAPFLCLCTCIVYSPSYKSCLMYRNNERCHSCRRLFPQTDIFTWRGREVNYILCQSSQDHFRASKDVIFRYTLSKLGQDPSRSLRHTRRPPIPD
jgi:hypothetical protein